MKYESLKESVNALYLEFFQKEGWTQQQVADYLEVDDSLLSCVRRGRKNLSLSLLERIARKTDRIPIIFRNQHTEKYETLELGFEKIKTMPVKEYVGRVLRLQRKRREVSQKEVIKKAKIKAVTYLSYVELGKRQSSIPFLQKIGKVLNLTPLYLVPVKDVHVLMTPEYHPILHLSEALFQLQCYRDKTVTLQGSDFLQADKEERITRIEKVCAEIRQQYNQKE